MTQPRRPRRRRAVGPPGSVAPSEPDLDLEPETREQAPPDDDDRLRADRPPHHDRGV